jgi:hypothetical protein
MKIPAIDGAENKFSASAHIARLINGVKTNFFFTASAYAPIVLSMHFAPFWNKLILP